MACLNMHVYMCFNIHVYMCFNMHAYMCFNMHAYMCFNMHVYMCFNFQEVSQLEMKIHLEAFHNVLTDTIDWSKPLANQVLE